ncbi:hypothetical protein AVANS_0144 [Campylobacter sp. RM5004]|uniref:hypothetical protein n=1 Tax=Campylobacter sp. RM5004 TaxID=1660078 RepID=UPI001EFAD38B|nr:hypothetical protein [Campylobacter sp. RM5004]ULO00796.1 hypothetical protein AVANS_0144 [Campylobacter sp. RM5004]
MQINSINQTSINNLNSKANQNNLKEQIAKILKDAPQDEWGTYDPNAVLSKIGAYEKDSKIYEALENEMLKGIITYGKDPNEEILSTKDSLTINSSDPAWVVALKLEVQPLFKFENNSIYQRAFYQNNDDSKELLEFLKENPIDKLSLSDKKFKKSFEDNDNRLEMLFANEEISIEDFKKEYLKLKAIYDENKLREEKEEQAKEEKSFKAIEVKGIDVSESMKDILSKLDIHNIKDERDLLALFLAYKNGGNLYDKRI